MALSPQAIGHFPGHISLIVFCHNRIGSERAGAIESTLRHHSLSFSEQIGQLAARRPSRHGFRRSMRNGEGPDSRRARGRTPPRAQVRRFCFRLICATAHSPRIDLWGRQRRAWPICRSCARSAGRECRSLLAAKQSQRVEAPLRAIGDGGGELVRNVFRQSCSAVGRRIGQLLDNILDHLVG